MPASAANYYLYLFFTFLIFLLVYANKNVNEDNKDKPDWKKKDIRDYSDADIERLYDQWEEGDEPLEKDELPEYLREPPKIDLSNIDPNNPEDLLKRSKKGRTLMLFASVSGNPNQQETEEISSLWQMSLFNAHIDLQRFVIDSNRVIFVLKDGAEAWQVKDFLVKQDRCEEVSIENKSYPGKGGKQKDKNNSTKKSPKEEL